MREHINNVSRFARGGFTNDQLSDLARIWAVIVPFALGLLVITPSNPIQDLPFSLTWWHLVLLFLGMEQVQVHYETKRGAAHTLTFTEMGLVVALTFGSPWALLIGRCVGGVTGSVLSGAKNPVKVAMNMSAYAIESAVGALIFYTFAGSTMAEPRAWIVAVLAGFAASAAGGIVVEYAIAKTFGFPGWGHAKQVLALSAGLSTASGIMGVAASLLLWENESTVFLLAGICLVAAVVHAHYQRIVQQNRDLTALQETVDTVPDTGRPDVVVNKVLQATLSVLRAESAALIARRLGAEKKMVYVTCTNNEYVERSVTENEIDSLINESLSTGLIDVPDWGENGSLVVPLHRDSNLIGVLAVTGRSRTTRRMDKTDTAILNTIAGQAGLHLDRSHLFSWLTHEVAERERQATIDETTGMLNQRGANERLHRAVVAAEGTSESLAVLAVQATTHNEVASTYGSEKAAALLRGVARRIESRFKEASVARIDAGNFLVVLPGGSDVVRARSVADALVALLAEPVVTDSVVLPSAAQVGIAMFPNDAASAHDLIRKAGIALLDADRNGSAVERYSSSTDPHGARSLSIAAELGAAIEHGTVDVHYQPQIDLKTRTVTGAEALFRWDDPALGPVAPDEAIAAAERTGTIHQLTRWVLDRAISDAAAWRRQGMDLRMSVNASVTNLLDPSFPKTVEDALGRHHLPGDRLMIEVTESRVLADSPRALETLEAIRRLDVGIAIDDFGTGFSSLSHLRVFPVTEVKIDKQFVQQVTMSDDDLAFVESIIGLGHRLGMEVVAEGVETTPAEALLQIAGCNIGQGYLYSRPVPVDRFGKWLQTQTTATVAGNVVPIRHRQAANGD